MTRQRVISLIFANVAGFFVVVWLMVAWIWSTDDGGWDQPVGSDRSTDAAAPASVPNKPPVAQPRTDRSTVGRAVMPVRRTETPAHLIPVSRRGISDLLKSHTASVSRCAQKSHLRGEVRSVDVLVSITPAGGEGSIVSNVEPRDSRDSRWGSFSGCLAKALALARFSEAPPQSFPITVRIP